MEAIVITDNDIDRVLSLILDRCDGSGADHLDLELLILSDETDRATIFIGLQVRGEFAITKVP